jgi:hypothetical protein
VDEVVEKSGASGALAAALRPLDRGNGPVSGREYAVPEEVARL